jgi:4-hydroxybenzoate polyprenyltransferase
VKEALAVGALLALAGVCAGADHQSGPVGLVVRGARHYLAYPYAKRFVSMPQAVLGVAFSFGIPMAFSAVTGDVPWLAWWLLAGQPVLGAGLRHRVRDGRP